MAATRKKKEEDPVEEKVDEEVKKAEADAEEIEKEAEEAGGAKKTAAKPRTRTTRKKADPEPEDEDEFDEPDYESGKEEKAAKPKRTAGTKKTAPADDEDTDRPDEEVSPEDMAEEENAEAEEESEDRPEPYYMEPETKRRTGRPRKTAAGGEKKQDPATMGSYMKDIHENPTVSITGTIEAETAAGRSIEKLREMNNSLRTGSPLTAVIAEVPANRDMPHAIVYYGPFRVLIPADRLLEKHEGAKDDMTGSERSVTAALNRRLGSEIDFVVTNIDAENHLATGDRVKAMENTRRQILGEKDANGDPMITKGRKLECRVMCVYPNGLFVEAKGMEGRIPRSELSYYYTEDENFVPGDKVEARIIDINDTDPDDPFLRLSIRQCDPNPFDLYADYIHKGDCLSGRVVKVTTGDLWCRLDNGMFALARPTNDTRISANPGQGTVIGLVVTNIDYDNKRVYGRLRYIGNKMR